MAIAHLLATTIFLALPVKHLLFGEPGGDWVVLNENGDLLLRSREIGGVRPHDAAISSDGKRWAVTTQGPQGRPELLLFSSLDSKPRRVVGRGNVLDGVGFSPDGNWVYFSSNDDAQPTFQNQPMLYAQVYRVRFETGEPERLTLSKGCHMWPKALQSRKVVVSHATCTGGRSLELLDVRTNRETVLLPPSANVGETAVHPLLDLLLYTQAVPAGTEFRVWDLSSGTSKLWGVVEVSSARIRPQWGNQGGAVFFQNNGRVWEIQADGKASQIVELTVHQ